MSIWNVIRAKFGLNDPDLGPVWMSNLSGALGAAQERHLLLNEGLLWVADAYDSGGSGTTATLIFTAPAAPLVAQLLCGGSGNVESRFTIGEGISWTGGTPGTPTRLDRRTPVLLPDTTVVENAVVTNISTVLMDVEIGAGKDGDTIVAGNYLIMEPGETYAVLMEAQSSNARVEVHAMFSEVEPRYGS